MMQKTPLKVIVILVNMVLGLSQGGITLWEKFKHEKFGTFSDIWEYFISVWPFALGVANRLYSTS